MFGIFSGGKRDTPPDFDTSSHASELLKAASSYLTSDLRKSLDLFVKTFEFTTALKNFSSPKHTIQAFEAQKEIDFEGLLKSVRPHCTKEEAEIVDLFLNMLSATNFYKTYQEMASMFATSSDNKQGNGSDHHNNSFNQAMGNQQMFDTLAEMLPPEQKSTLETMKTLMDSGILSQMFS